jgi:hypothetical protein
MGLFEHIKRKKKIAAAPHNGVVPWDVETLGMVEKIYTDIFGNHYYRLKDITRISLKRSIAAEAALRTAEFCISEKKLLELTGKIKEALVAQDLSLANALVYEIESRTKFLGEEETLLGLATVYVYLENEPLKQYAPYYQDKKRELWSKDQEAQDFFLELAWRLTKQYSDMSDIDILTYLREIKEIERNLLHYFMRKS